MYPLSSCQNNNIAVTAVAATGCVQTVNFANGVNPIRDMHIQHLGLYRCSSGQSYIQKCVITNQGTVAEPAALAGYKTDGQLNTATFVPGGVFSAGPANWYSSGSNLPNLAPGASSAFNVTYNVPTNIPMSTMVAVKKIRWLIPHR